MTDLIERLEELKSRYDRGLEIQASHEIADRVLMNFDTILSALKTVRGIEGLASEWTVKVSAPMEDAVNQRESRWLIEFDRRHYYGSTLDTAVEAAGKKQ